MSMRKIPVVATLVTMLAAPAMAGFHYKAATSATGEGAEMAAITVEGWVDAGNAKIVFEQSANPMMGTGTYLLTTDGGKTMYLVNPREKTYSKWDLEAMMGMAGSLMNSIGGMVKMEVTDPKVEKLLEESGGSIHGFPTTHYKYRTSYTMNMKIMGIKRGQHTVDESEVWTTTALNDEGFGVWLKNRPKATGLEAFDKLMEAEYEKATGFVLKSINRSTTTPAKGGESQTTSATMEVTVLEEQAVPASTFVLDSSYQEVPMMPLPGAVPQGEEGDEEPQQEEEGGRLFKKLKKRIGG